MKILAFSDTHSFHSQFKNSDFEGIDMLIFAGDESNPKNPIINEPEARNFLTWYNSLDMVKYRIFICGNHSTAIEDGLVNPKHYENIIYLEHESVCIEGINIFGSPYTPEFCGWSYNVRRDKLDNYWKEIPENIDILVIHGPPKGILDLSYNRNGELEYCGDAALYKHIQRVKPKEVIFGHIHNCEGCHNSGFYQDNNGITYRNVSCVTDNKFNLGLTSKGQIFEYDTTT
jgi:Icc-related predicted phosphoesterase